MKFLAFCLLLLTMQARGATNAELEAQVESLTQRVQKLERLLSEVMEARGAEAREVVATTSHQAASAKPVATKPAAAGSSLKMGGRVKLDVIANSVSVGGTGGQNRGDVALFPNAIPLTASGEDHQLSGNARDSRLWVNATNSTDYGDLGAYIELDFGSYDNSGNERVSNSHNPRIRHAYATYGGFTVGQTTSTFQNMIAFPEINEANGPAGVLNTRQPLVRYSGKRDAIEWSIAAEQPETTITASNGARIAYDDDQLPDMVGRLDWHRDTGTLSLSALIRQIRVDDAFEDEATGAGVSLSGRWFLPNSDNIRFALTHGKGIGRYVSYNSFNDAVLKGSRLKIIPVQSAFASYQHWWNDNWRSNVALGYAQADLNAADYATGLVNESYFSSHLNLLWSPIKSATFGIEWLHGKRTLLNGDTGSLNRVQFTSLYKFHDP